MRLQNILSVFDEFQGDQIILSERQIQDYHSTYIDLYEEFRKKEMAQKEIINDDLVFEIELIKQVEINIEYILELLKKYQEEQKEESEILSQIDRAINSTVKLRNKKELIREFISRLSPTSIVEDDWEYYVKRKVKEELDKIIEEENLNREATYRFIQKCFYNGYVSDLGVDFADILPPMSRFSKENERSKKAQHILERLQNYFMIFNDIVSEENFSSQVFTESQ